MIMKLLRHPRRHRVITLTVLLDQGLTHCTTCEDLLCNDTPQEWDEAIQEITKDWLIYPSNAWYQLTDRIGRTLLKEIGFHSLHQDTIFQALHKISKLSLSRGGCKQHKEVLTIILVN